MLQWLSVCDSTSRVVKDSMSDGFSTPIALAAGVQTGGIGRLGRSWQSAEGNIHLSLALPPGFLDPAMVPFVPLMSGVIVSEWVQHVFGLAPCLKWPNDLFVDGRKVGGILCEAIYCGSEYKGVIIGIGLNLIKAPDLGDDSDYRAGFLMQEANSYSSAAKVQAEMLMSYFLQKAKKYKTSDVLSKWRRFATKPEHIWVKSAGNRTPNGRGERDEEMWLDCGVDDNGYLKLGSDSTLKEKSKVILVNSVAGDHKWSLAKLGKTLVADVGNSETKVAIVSNHNGVNLDSVVVGTAAIKELLQDKLSRDLAPMIHCVSVNPDGLAQLRQTVEKLGFFVREIHKEPVRLLQSTYDLKALGADRFAALEAAYYLFQQKSLSWPLMLVSLGTATTVDLIDSNGLHLGGYIVAGMQTSLEALLSRGRLLPKGLHLFDKTQLQNLDSWPTSTSEAILRGTIRATLGFIETERAGLAKHCGVAAEHVSVYLTGGFAEPLAADWRTNNVVADSKLTLLGAGLLAFNGR